MLNEMNFWLAKRTFGLRQRLAFYRLLLAFLEDNNTVLDAVNESAEFYGTRALGFMFRHWLRQLRNGAKLAEVVDGWIKPAEIAFIQAGEERANLAEPLGNLVLLLEKQDEASRKLVETLSTPIGYLIMFLTTVFGIALYVVPEFAAAMPMENAQWISRWFFSACEWLAQWGVWIVFWFIVAAVVSVSSLAYLTGPVRKALDGLPPYSIFRRIQSSYFLISLSSLFRSGVGIQEAVIATAEFASPWMKSHLRVVSRKVREGMNEGDALQTGMMPKDMAGEVQRYARLSGFERACFRIGNSNMTLQLDRLARWATFAKYFAMFGMAALIGTFLFAIMGVVAPLLQNKPY
ncbi:hypothetical protein E4T66_17985 [Sinimarinibacterium sp. CAU 1509]|uniref:type II secretion system F family protein n=1 Tax=Sinimarinibacterium sp. CAU 1509 TaxID=2562283 RepID=UPI0010AC3740|nr:type II secretion system F family protein [Sinimarinibacterium sp. CAU 1509]TJY57296.1 hypothetical protein E4T66_17985 [Sinimarinibacterium sp. CAU 1509]